MTSTIAASLVRRTATVAAAAIWVGGSLAAGAADSALKGVDVYGSERFDAAALRSEFSADFERYAEIEVSLTAGNSADPQADGAALRAIEAKITGALRERAPLAEAELSAVTYFSPSLALYITVDVVEQADAARRMPFRTAPTGSFQDPDGLLAAWEAYSDTVFRLIRSGLSPSVEPGQCPVLHCLVPFNRPELAPYLPIFNDGVRKHAAELAAIAAQDADARQRADAVFLLAHTNDAARLLPLLGRAIRDPDDAVRNNALRVLMVLATDHPDLDFPIADLIAALDFPSTSDRNKAAYCVAALAAAGKYRDEIRKDAVPAALKLLRLDQPNNHEPAYLILRALSGEHFGDRDYAAWQAWAAAHR